MPSPAQDDYKPALAAALVGGVAAAVGTFVPGELPAWISALVTLFASVAAWALARVITHPPRRAANAVLGTVLALVSVGLVVTGEAAGCAPQGVTCLVGGCEPYSVHVQNRYAPLGAAVRAEPRREGRQVGAHAPNKLLPVDGWVRTQPAYPSNAPPFDSDYWFHLADDSGWVAFAGVRADPTTPATDPSDSDGGTPAPAPPECRGTFRSNS